jgi:hypothetical protein
LIGAPRLDRGASRQCKVSIKEEAKMAEPGGRGVNMQPYGVMIREKSKSADLNTLQAYRIVAHDLLKGASGPGADDLRASLDDLEKAIKAKGGK